MTLHELISLLEEFPENSEVELKLCAKDVIKDTGITDYIIQDMHVRSWKINNKEEPR